MSEKDKPQRFEYDGNVRKIKDLSEIKRGMILRDVNPDGTSPPFSDMVVFNITYSSNSRDSWTHIHLARPYAFAHQDTPLMNVETLESHTLEYKRLVLNSRGEPYIMKLDRD